MLFAPVICISGPGLVQQANFSLQKIQLKRISEFESLGKRKENFQTDWGVCSLFIQFKQKDSIIPG